MRKPSPRGRHAAKSVLRLPDLEHAKSSVLNSLVSAESRRSYEFAIQNFVQWYCSEPRLALNRIVVTRYRMGLEQLHLAPSTINQRLAAVRRLAYEAADAGLLSPELAAGISRVKGVKQLGVRLGNWLTAGGSLGHRGSRGQRRPHPHRTGSGVGQTPGRRLVPDVGNCGRPRLQVHQQERARLGNWLD